jgi:hypothetical protein
VKQGQYTNLHLGLGLTCARTKGYDISYSIAGCNCSLRKSSIVIKAVKNARNDKQNEKENLRDAYNITIWSTVAKCKQLLGCARRNNTVQTPQCHASRSVTNERQSILKSETSLDRFRTNGGNLFVSLRYLQGRFSVIVGCSRLW